MRLTVRRWWALCSMLLVIALTGCSAPLFQAHVSTPTPQYTLPSGGACVHLGSHPVPPYVNVRVSTDAALGHSEPELAENPNNPQNLVGGSKFFTDLAHYKFKIGYFTSFDGGCTWADGGILPGFDHDIVTSDISFAFGTHNDVYGAVLRNGPNGDSALSVSTSLDGGKTFGQPVDVSDSPTGLIFSDKPWIAVDRTNGPNHGDIYVVWSYDHFEPPCNDPNFTQSCAQELGFSRSTDGGKTFSPTQLVEGNAPFCTNPTYQRASDSRRCDAVLGATPAILPDGNIAVAYAYVDLNGGPIATKMVVTTSADAGATWTAPVLVSTVTDLPGHFTGEKYRIFALPAFVADPQTGQLYLAWADERFSDADVLLVTSTDRGQTWSAVHRVNDDPQRNGANQFQPQLAIAPNGVISVSFLDTRTDPAHKLIDVYLAQSLDHGTTFLPNVRVTTQSWDPTIGAPTDGYGQQFIGDYQGLSADNQFVHPFWNDTRTGKQDIFTAAVPSAQPGTQR